MWIDERYQATAGKRRQKNVGTLEQYVAYFAGANTPDNLIRLLKAHAHAPAGKPFGWKLIPFAASVLASLSYSSTLAAPGDEGCKRELFMADAAVSGSYRNMEMGGAKPEEQCAAWRRHVEAMRKASAAYARCAVGPAKAKTAELDGSAADFRRLIGERCKGK